ncbi:MAG: hypothetical protein ABIH23_09310 [bacterium]
MVSRDVFYGDGFRWNTELEIHVSFLLSNGQQDNPGHVEDTQSPGIVYRSFGVIVEMIRNNYAFNV